MIASSASRDVSRKTTPRLGGTLSVRVQDGRARPGIARQADRPGRNSPSRYAQWRSAPPSLASRSEARSSARAPEYGTYLALDNAPFRPGQARGSASASVQAQGIATPACAAVRYPI